MIGFWEGEIRVTCDCINEHERDCDNGRDGFEVSYKDKYERDEAHDQNGTQRDLGGTHAHLQKLQTTDRAVLGNRLDQPRGS